MTFSVYLSTSLNNNQRCTTVEFVLQGVCSFLFKVARFVNISALKPLASAASYSTALLETRKLRRTWYRDPMVAEVGGITLFTKKKSASSGLKLILFLMRK